MLVLKSGLLIFNLVFFYDWRAAACGTLDGARSRYIQFFFSDFSFKVFFFSYIFREKINVVSGPGAGGKGTEKKKNNRIFFFHVMLFLSLALSSKIGIVVWFMFCFFVCFFSNPNLIIGKSLDLRFCNRSCNSSNGATVKSFPSYSKGSSFSGIIIIFVGDFLWE